MNPSRPPRPAFVGSGARLAALLGLFAICGSTQAQQVHKCQVEGRTVFQSSACAVETPKSPATSRPAIAAEPATAAVKKPKTLADLLRERDAAVPSHPPTREFEGDGANVLRSRMGAV